jgi:hypothetical protein
MQKLRIVMSALILSLAVSGVASAQTNFAKDVNDTLDAWIVQMRAQNALTGGTAGNSTGLMALAFLEKHDPTNPGAIVGYNNLLPADQTRVQAAILFIINNHFGAFIYLYRDGQDLMALSDYARTGGPEPAGATHTVRATIDAIVDRLTSGQTVGGVCNGYWGYSGTGCDSSTTQYGSGGLAAALAYYNDLVVGCPGVACAPDRRVAINTALGRTKDGYASTSSSSPDPVDAGKTEGGWGYQATGYEPSYQQTASGLWASLLGGATLNDPQVQRGLRWERNRYNYHDIHFAGNFWGTNSFGYYMFSSSKAYELLKLQGATPNAGNIGPDDVGSLGANAALARLAHRDPTVDPCARTNFPGLCNGSYAAEPQSIYYDYAYTIMSRQAANGTFTELAGDAAWDFYSNQAYYALVLERSLGAVNPPPVCTNAVAATATGPLPMLWPIDKTMVNGIFISGVTDDGGPANLTFTINSIMTDEPTNADGVNFPDAVIHADGTFDLRRERGISSSQAGNGRFYVVNFTASDSGGQSCTQNVNVIAPRTPALFGSAVNDGAIYDATKKNP